ncbi:phage tail tape measure protein [Diplocloster agilis]|uniref:phage tail tape measure protein n=1 Tax=Diplocloster agilis TaxID=2850323 RepID=UPI0008203B2B|nr:phage tail tape measure protein [Suonthocola fibrivorans]MCU6736850.1 phage tail tape measure protein [Suonthocola fibrivorans]SCJ93986.1 Phage-related protein [uncultured Clostridium sp.]
MGVNENNMFPDIIKPIDIVQIDLDKLVKQAARSQSELNKLEIASNGVGGSFKDAANNSNKFCKSMEDSENKTNSFGDNLMKTGKKFAKEFSEPMLAAGKNSFNFAIDAEESFLKVGSVIDSTVITYDKLKSEVKRSSNETGTAITDFNEALYASIDAGIDSADAIQFTTDMIKLSRSGFTDTQKAVEAVALTLDAYGMTADQASDVSDKLIATHQLGKIAVDELVTSMDSLIPSAASANMDLDNVSAAMIALTQNGLSTAEATKYYNTLLEELGESGSNADTALRNMSGKGFSQLIEEGRPVTDILKMLQDGAEQSGISMDEMLGSAEAAQAAMVIMKEGGSDYNQILGEIQDSAGATRSAFEKINSTPTVKIQTELNKLKNAGVEVGEKLIPLVTQGIEFIGKLADKFTELTPEQQKMIVATAGIATAMGPLAQVTGTTITGIKNISGGIKDMLSAASKKAPLDSFSQGLGSAASAAGDSAAGISGFSQILSNIAAPAGGILVAVGAIAALSSVLKSMHEEAVRTDLEEHFGNIKLSAEQVEETADRITTKDWTLKLDAVIEAQETLNQFEGEIQSAIDDMNRAKWKVDVGIGLSVEEAESYKQSVMNYVNNVQNYIQQQHYTTDLAIDALLVPGSDLYHNTKQFSDQFYNEMNGELSKLGTELSDLVNEAWEDNFLSDSVMELIDQKYKEIQDKLSEYEQAKYEVELQGIQISAPKNGLDVESFEELQTAVHEKLDQQKEKIEQAKIDLLVPYQVSYNKKEINNDDYNEIKRDILLDADRNLGNLTVDAIQIEIDTIKGNYQEVTEKSVDDLSSAFNERIKQFGVESDAGNVDWSSFWNMVSLDFSAGASSIKGKTKKGIRELVKNMEPDAAELKRISQEYKKAGKIVPSSIQEGLQEYYNLAAVAGTEDINAMYSVLADEIINSENLQNTLAAAQSTGAEIPQELADALKDNYGLVYDSGSEMYKQIRLSTDEEMEGLIQAMNTCGFMLTDSLCTSFSQKNPEVLAKTAELLGNISNGVAVSQEDLNTIMSTLGISLSDNMIDSLASKEPEVQSQTISLLNALVQGTQLKEEELVSLFSGLGFQHSNELIASLAGKGPEVQQQMIDLLSKLQSGAEAECPQIAAYLNSQGVQLPTDMLNKMGLTISGNGEIINSATGKAKEVVSSMNNVTEGAELTGPKLGEIRNVSSVVNSAIQAAQIMLDNTPIISTIVHRGSADRNAAGGIIKSKSLSWLAEEGYPEAVIPLNPNRRNKAVDLWEQTGTLLGINYEERNAILDSALQANTVANRVDQSLRHEARNFIDYRKLAASLAEELRNAPIKPDISIEMQEGNIIMDSELVGRKTAPTISRILSKHM